jgi:hypothetical protein
MNTKSILTLTSGILLAVSLACGGGGGSSPSSSGPTATTAVQPVLTAPAYAAASIFGAPFVNGATAQAQFTVSTQVQSGCTYNWTVSDTKAQIVSGQGTPTLVVSGPFSATPESLQVGVTVTATSNSLTATTLVQVVAPPQGNFTVNADPVNHPVLTATPFSLGVITFTANATFTWTVTEIPQGSNTNIASISSGQYTNGITLTASQPGSVAAECDITDPVTSLVTKITETLTAFDSSVPKPTMQTATGPNPINYNAANVVISVPVQAGCTYAWTNDQGTITAGATTNSITWNAPAPPSDPNASPWAHFYLMIHNAGGTTQVNFTAKLINPS